MKETGSAASLKAAQKAAAKVNAMLVASGQLKLSELNKNRTKNNKTNDLFIEEVVINDAPMSARNFLTRSSTQEEISKMSGAAVSTRGRYMTQEERDSPPKNPSDRPLYLHIQAVNQQDVKVAVGRITHIIMEHSHRKGHSMQRQRGPRPNPAPGLMGPRPGSGPRGPRPLSFRPPRPDISAPPLSSSQPQPPAPPPVFREKVFLPMNIGLSPSDLQARLMGESGMNLRYIQDETAVAISIRGIGSGFQEAGVGQESQDPLHFYLEHDNQEQFNQAKDLVVNLSHTVISEVQQELQQQQQQQQQQQHQQQQQQLQLQQQAPLFTQPPPQQPDVTLGGGGSLGQPQLTTVQVAPHHLAPQPPPPQLVHPQMGPPQVTPHTHTQLVAPHTQLPQMAGTQVSAGVVHTVLAPHLAAAPGVGGEVVGQQEVVQATVVSLPQQVVQLTAPTVSSSPAMATQQLVHTSSGTQLVTLPPGTQIINTPEGPRLVALAGAAPMAPSVPAGPQTLAASLHDPQVQQQQHMPQALAMSQAPLMTDGGALPPMARPMAPSNTYSVGPALATTASTAGPVPAVAQPPPAADSAFPPNVSATVPPPSTSMSLGMPPPTLAVPPVVTAHAGATATFVLTPGVNTMTTTSPMSLLMTQEPAITANHMHLTQPVLVTSVLPSLQQQQQPQPQPQAQPQHTVGQGGPATTYLGPVPGQPVPHTLEQQPVSSAYMTNEQSYNAAAAAAINTTTTHYAPPPQQRVAFTPVGDAAHHARMDYPGGGAPGVMGSPVPLCNLPLRHQVPKVEQQQPGQSQFNGQEMRPVCMEQQWQQFQQQVKMEGGQQPYDPYSAATEDGDHQDSMRHNQATQQQHQQSLSQQPTQQQYGGFVEQTNHHHQQQQQQQQQQPDSMEGGSMTKSEVKTPGHPSPGNSSSSQQYFGGQHSQSPHGQGEPRYPGQQTPEQQQQQQQRENVSQEQVGPQEDQYQQGPPQQPLPDQHYQPGPAPGSQYPWAQYPQPVPFSGAPGPPSMVPLGRGSAGPYQRREVSGTYSDDRHPLLTDKKAEPGVAREMTGTLLMPPPPPSSGDNLLGSRIREETTDLNPKRQSSCSPQDERRLQYRHGPDTEDVDGEVYESNRLMRLRSHEPDDDGHYRGSPDNYADTGHPGGFHNGPGAFRSHRGPWGWRQVPGPYPDLRPGPYRGSGANLSTSQAPYGRSLCDRPELEESAGGGWRLSRGMGGRGGFVGSRRLKEPRW